MFYGIQNYFRKSLITPEVVRIEHSVIDELPTKVNFVLPPRSLYIMQGVWRYQYGHAVSLPLLPGDIMVLDSTKLLFYSMIHGAKLLFIILIFNHK
eukprot:scaffold4964_cov248-Ochromonas_danica.AAC.11